MDYRYESLENRSEIQDIRIRQLTNVANDHKKAIGKMIDLNTDLYEKYSETRTKLRTARQDIDNLIERQNRLQRQLKDKAFEINFLFTISSILTGLVVSLFVAYISNN